MGSTETSWSTRQYPGVPGYQDFGTPWEDTVIFANTTGMDVWVNIPIGADNDYVTKVFQLLKYGSNGRDPYTVQTHDPATWQQGVGWYPGLLPGRKVYVEFTNELFSYYSYGDPQGAADIAAVTSTTWPTTATRQPRATSGARGTSSASACSLARSGATRRCRTPSGSSTRTRETGAGGGATRRR